MEDENTPTGLDGLMVSLTAEALVKAARRGKAWRENHPDEYEELRRKLGLSDEDPNALPECLRPKPETE